MTVTEERDYRCCDLCGLMAYQHSPKFKRCQIGHGTFLSTEDPKFNDPNIFADVPAGEWWKRLMEKWAPPGSVFPPEEK